MTTLELKSGGQYPQNGVSIPGICTYAAEKGFIPLYMLYNYVQNTTIRGIGHEELYGCTVIDANYLKRYHSTKDGNLSERTTFSILHPHHAFPWHELVCGNSRLLSLIRDSDLTSLDNDKLSLVKYSQPLDLSDQWKEIDMSYPTVYDDEKIQGVIYREEYLNSDLQRTEKEDTPVIFIPKFKIVVYPSIS